MLQKALNRLRRKNRIRAKISGTAARPRLAVFRSNTHISLQLIDDNKGITLCAASDLKAKAGTKTESSVKVAEDMAKKMQDLKITEIVFDRG